MGGPKKLIEMEGQWTTDMGAWFPGKRVVFRGKDLFTELGDLPWLGLALYAITGKIFKENEIRMIDVLHSMSGSFPEPRLWNNRVAALAGTARATASLAVSAATAVSEATIYGKQADLLAIDFIKRAQLCSKDSLGDFVLNELKEKRKLGGFGRPIATRDERIAPVLAAAKILHCEGGPHLKTALQIEKFLHDQGLRICLNIGGIAAGICADLGMNNREYNYITVLVFAVGNLACYMDSSSKAVGTFFPLACDRISYSGHGFREWEK